VKLGHLVRLMPKRLNDIDAAACERFIETRLEEGVKQTTVKKEIRALGAMLRHAKRQGLYMRDIEAVVPELEETYRPRERFLLPLEFVALVGALSAERAAHVVFIVCTGARWGESCRARRQDVAGHMVLMRGTKTRLAKGTVPVPPQMRIALQWALANAPGEEGRPMFAPWGNVRRDLAQACAAIGIAPVTPNDLRRTFATWLSMAGMTADMVGKALRHTTGRMAETVYGRIKPADLDRLISEHAPALHLEPHSTHTAQAPMEYAKSADVIEMGERIENPRVGSSILSLGTVNPGEPPSDSVSATPLNQPESATSQHISSTAFRQRARRWLTRRVAA
jgi:integrase